MRGVRLPGWDDDVGLATNVFWAEVLRREEELEASKLRWDAFMTYIMSGLSPSFDVKQRNDLLDPFFDEVLSKMDHSAYTVERKMLSAMKRVAAARERVAELERLRWIASEDFSIEAWMNFEDVKSDE